MLFTSWTFEHFTELYYSISEGVIIFHFSLHLCRQSSPTFEQEHVFSSGKSCCPSSAVTGTRRPTEPRRWRSGAIAIFLKPKQLTIWWCEVRTVR